LLWWCILVACADRNAGGAEATEPGRSPASKSASHRHGLVPARFFADPANRRFDVRAVRRRTEPAATVAGHYSQAIVNCGIGCTVFWMVDRRTGAIIAVPPGSSDTEAVYDVRGRRDSDRVEVLYGPNPALGLAGECRARAFRLRGTQFTALGGFSPAPCP